VRLAAHRFLKAAEQLPQTRNAEPHETLNVLTAVRRFLQANVSLAAYRFLRAAEKLGLRVRVGSSILVAFLL
jgi:hypothetical protein